MMTDFRILHGFRLAFCILSSSINGERLIAMDWRVIAWEYLLTCLSDIGRRRAIQCRNSATARRAMSLMKHYMLNEIWCSSGRAAEARRHGTGPVSRCLWSSTFYQQRSALSFLGRYHNVTASITTAAIWGGAVVSATLTPYSDSS